MRRVISTLTILALAVTGAGSAIAEESDGPAPTEVHMVEASADGTTVAVAAHIEFGGQAPVVLAEDPVGDAPPNGSGQGDAFGLDLTGVRAYRADPNADVLTFEWQTTNLSQLPPPEVMRYYWQFTIGGASFAAQAKTTDFVSAANLGDGTPEAIASNVASYADSTVPSFRIRGNCGTVGVLNNCGHVAWVTGEFDFDADLVRIHLPLDLENSPALRPGAVLVPVGDGTYSAIQLGADLAQTRDTVAIFDSYVVPVATATARLLDADGTAVGTATLAEGDDGVWSGIVTAPGPGTYTLEVNGCFADNCGTAPTTVTVG